MSRAVLLLSGGLDSTVCLALALHEGCTVMPMCFDYGQHHRVELDAARTIARHYDLFPEFVRLPRIKGSALTGTGAVPLDRPLDAMTDVPVTYVPGRNLIFLAHALSFAEAQMATEVWIGVNDQDYSGYPDCRPDFIKSLQALVDVGTKAGTAISIRAPLLGMRKTDIIQLGRRLGAPLQMTRSCYQGVRGGCGRCDSCKIRAAAFADLGLEDPAGR